MKHFIRRLSTQKDMFPAYRQTNPALLQANRQTIMFDHQVYIATLK